MLLMDKAHLGEHIKVGVGREAVGAKRDVDPTLQEFAEGVRGVAKRGMGARAIDDGGFLVQLHVGRKVIAMDQQKRTRPQAAAEDLFGRTGQPFLIPDAEFL